MKIALRKLLPLLLCLILCLSLAPAAWADGYTITFHANGGYGSMDPQNVWPGESVMLNANTFTRTNYAFSHWSTRPDGSGTSYADQGDITPKASLTLYAQWVKTSYSVYYDKNGGGGWMQPDSINKWSAGTVKANAFNAPNYSLVFGEWNTRADGSGISYQPGDIIRSDSVPNDITLYAIWLERLTVWFYPGEGGGSTTAVEYPKGSAVKLPSYTSLGFEAPAGQTFAGWEIEGESRLYKSGEVYTFNTEKKVTAKWGDTITITYDPNGGVPASPRKLQRVAKDNDTKLATIEQIGYTRPGYAFLGWALTPSSKEARWEDAEWVYGGFSVDTTLYAVWEQQTFIGIVTISGSLSSAEDIGFVGETLTATVTGEKLFMDFSYQWLRDGIAIENATAETYVPSAEDFGCGITCDVTARDAIEGKTKSSTNYKFIYIEEEDKRIVNNGQVESDYVYGVYPGLYYSVNNGAKQPVSLTTGGAFPVTQQGIYRFFLDAASNAPVAVINVYNWWTIGYNISTGTGDSSGNGTVTMKRGSTTITSSTTLRDSSGNVILQPYSLSGYSNVSIVRQDAGITDITLTVKPSYGSYGHVSLNGGGYDSSSSERVFNLGTIYSPKLYDVAFIRSGSMPKYDTGLFLPASLTEIEAEAFAGGRFEYIRVPAGVTKIGSRAFADCPYLRYIEIQGMTTEIAPDSFYGAYGVTICAPFNSSAAAFAKEYGIPFIATS